MYFNGASWQPVKTLNQDNLLPYLVGLNDFAFISPILLDDSKLAVPNVQLDRIFVNNDLDFNYRKINNVSVEYNAIFLENKTSAFIHVNAGRLTNIRKRLFRFDKDDVVINMSAENTEFYGYRDYDIDGELLIPKLAGTDSSNSTFDYEVMHDGIYLSNDAAQKYDYILAVTHEFEWIRSAGSMFAVKGTSNIIAVENLDESMVYHNGKLLCNHVAISSDIPQEVSDLPKYANNFRHNEIRCFVPKDKFTATDPLNGLYYYWNSGQEKWIELYRDRISGIQTIAGSYTSTRNSVRCNFSFSKSDDIRVYGFKYSNSVQNPPIIKNIVCKTPQSKFNVAEKFNSAEKSLSVYVNGIRQYHVKEHDNLSFELPDAVVGIVTCGIEKPENGYTQTAEREILDENNVVQGAVNVYRTNISLYPGRVILYINGLRQNRDNFTVLDKHTLVINSSQALIGNKDNFPLEKPDADTEIIHRLTDQILVEVKHDYGRIDSAMKIDNLIDSSIPISDEELLKTKVNIFIYLNGLFTGMKLDEDYSVDFYGNAIRFYNSDFVEKVSSNALQSCLASNSELQQIYRIFNKGLIYDKPNNELILEWGS